MKDEVRERDRIDDYLTKYNLWLDDDARTDLIMLCNYFHEEGLSAGERAGIERAAQEYECKPGWDGKVIHQRGMPRNYCEMCEIADNLRALATSEEK